MRKLLLLPLGLFLTLIFVEIGLRLQERLVSIDSVGAVSGASIKSEAMSKFVQKRIGEQWDRGFQGSHTYFEPPIDVFTNSGFDDPKRMAYIAEKSRLPISITSTQQNFLRLNKTPDIGRFTVQTNALGFRGKDYPAKKADDTFRVIVLGSYVAFGHGVNDEETYAFHLEQFLRQNVKNKKIEIWNGGRQSGTSIMGLARLENEIEAYNPDLIIWDFGWVELYLANDITEPGQNEAVVTHENSGLKLMRRISRYCSPVRAYLKSCEQLSKKMKKIGREESLEGWRESMRRMKSWTQARSIPVIYLWHVGVTIPESEYVKFDAPEKKFDFLNTKPALDEKLTEAELNEFWREENWVTEIGYDRATAETKDPWVGFFTDAIQYNKFAHKRIGKYIGSYILKHKGKFGLK